jgi:NADH-quinone oxidoreductase subunit K
MGIELMLNAVNLALIAFSSNMRQILTRFVQGVSPSEAADIIGSAMASGQVLVFLVMTVAAAEAAVGLAIIISIYRLKDSVNVDDVNIMKW